MVTIFGPLSIALRFRPAYRFRPDSLLRPQYPNLSEGTDRVGGQHREDKECPFSGVTKSGRVWRKVPESDARNVTLFLLTGNHALGLNE